MDARQLLAATHTRKPATESQQAEQDTVQLAKHSLTHRRRPGCRTRRPGRLCCPPGCPSRTAGINATRNTGCEMLVGYRACGRPQLSCKVMQRKVQISARVQIGEHSGANQTAGASSSTPRLDGGAAPPPQHRQAGRQAGSWLCLTPPVNEVTSPFCGTVSSGKAKKV